MRELLGRVGMLPREDEDDPRVLVAASLEALLGGDEQVRFRGRPSARYAWGDHDPLEPVRATSMQPRSRVGRISVSILCAGLIGLFGIGGFRLCADALESLGRDPLVSLAAQGLIGLTLLSPLPLLLRPLVNIRRTRRLEYVLTDTRGLVVRNGPAWGDLLTRSPL